MTVRILAGDCRAVLATLAAGSVHACVTSPPYYGLRSYLAAGHTDKALELGSESTLDAYVAEMVAVFREVRRVLRDDGTLWLNIGDSYASGGRGAGMDGPAGAKQRSNEGALLGTKKPPPGFKEKDLLMVPARVALALHADGWWLRSDIIWSKPNPMPESVSGSQFIRHQVTFAEYERLLHMRRIRPIDQGASDLSSVQAGKIPSGQTSVPAERQGESDSASTGRAPGREREAEAGSHLAAGPQEPSQVRNHFGGQADTAQGEQEIPSKRAWEDGGGSQASLDQGHAAEDSAARAGQREVCADGEDEGEEAPRLRTAKIGDHGGKTVHRGNVAGNAKSTQTSLLLLQEAPDADARSHNASEQGRHARRGEHRSGLPVMQCTEERQDDPDRLIDCPGCEKCERHDGYIFRMSAGRPTSAHEHVFMLTKAARYFFDAEAVREQWTCDRDDMREKGVRTGMAYLQQGPVADNSTKRIKIPGGWDRGEGAHGTIHRDGRTSAEYQEAPVRAGRNIRNVWEIATAPFPEAHFATFPPELAERCIKAGTSERGCCAACGAPWGRVVERARMPRDLSRPQARRAVELYDTAELTLAHIDAIRACGVTDAGKAQVTQSGAGKNKADVQLLADEAKAALGGYYREFLLTGEETTGWRPTCACPEAAPVPCTVLDPFAGAGTTLLVADRLQRDAVGIELNPDYCAMMRRRIEGDAPLFASVE